MAVEYNLKKGDLITHTRCLGVIEEHYFTGFDGVWICGKPTKETKKFGGMETNDIHFKNITHINREHVDTLKMFKKIYSLPENCDKCIENSKCKNTGRVDNAYGGLECNEIRKG